MHMEENKDLYATADFCLIPMGTSSSSVREYIAACQEVLSKSGLEYKMHGYGTNLEGPWSAVCQAIQDCHIAVHKMGAGRIATDVRIGTRVDRDFPNEGLNTRKVQRVEELLSQWKVEKTDAGLDSNA